MALKPYTHTDGRTLFLGKQPAKFPKGTPQFHNYRTAAIPPALAAVDWYKGVTSWGTMMNTTLGCCVISSKGHDIQVCSLNTTGEVTLADSVIQDYYSWWNGYVVGDPDTDNGCVMSQIIHSWHVHGMAGYKLPAYAAVDWKKTQDVLKTIELFGNADIGLQLPLTAQGQIGGVWDVVGDPTDPSSPSFPGSWGGHDVNCGKYATQSDGSIMYTPITWGANQQMTQKFLATYGDEVWALLLGIWFDPDGLSASGFNWQQMIADMPLVAN